MSMHYHEPEREEDLGSLPNIETFYHEGGTLGDVLAEDAEPGWYFWFCYPGCLPDSDPEGPHETEKKAVEAARLK